METYTVNGRTITIKNHIFEGKKTYQEYERSIYQSLKKIGISKEFITISKTTNGINVSWKINDSTFAFHCTSQETQTQNIGALSQAIQEDIRQILRGIKDLNLVMKQYQNDESQLLKKKKKSLEDYSTSFENEYKNSEEEIFPTTFSSHIEAKEVISKIKEKYANFTDLALLPEHDKTSLREAYLYLGIVVKF